MQGPFPIAPSKSTPIYTDEFFTGLWTQRNPLRDAGVPYLYRRSGMGTRFDSLIDGLNRELTPKLTLRRRAGHSIYNSQNFPPINRFHEFRTFSGATEQIRVMADCVADLYDATGPNTKRSIYTKAAGSGPSFLQTIGNNLYWGDGVNQKKWVQSAKSWTAAHTFTSLDFIVDSNLNLQVAMGARSANITNVSLTGGVCTVTFDARVALKFFTGMKLTIAGLTGAAFLNTAVVTLTAVNYQQVVFNFAHADYASAADIGTASCAGGNTGGVEPAWSAVRNGITFDGNEQWLCKGSSVQNMGIATPTIAPTALLAPRQGLYPDWAADTIYSTSLAVLDSNLNIQVLTTGGTTGAIEPVWNVVVGGVTADNTAQWTNMGPATRANLTAYGTDKITYQTWSYWVTVPGSGRFGSPGFMLIPLLPFFFLGHHSFSSVMKLVEKIVFSAGFFVASPDEGVDDGYSYEVTVTGAFQCSTAGITGAAPPAWVDGVGATVADGTVVWTNIGSQASWAVNVGANTKVSLAQKVIDSNGNVQNITSQGKSAAVHPAWATAIGGVTVDNLATWTNAGPFSAAGTAPWLYVYQGKNSVTNTISTASPESASIIVTADKLINVQGKGFDDPQVDVIQIYRTAQGGSTLLLLDEIQAPLTSSDIWTYSDPSFDNRLNVLIQANLAFIPPPTGIINFAFHLNRLWGSVGNTVYFSTGPDDINGSGYEAFAALNSFIFPSSVRRLWPTSIGLIVFTVSDSYIILGKGTASDGFYPLPFAEKIGLLHYDAFCVNGTTAFMMTNSKKVISLDPGAGQLQVGFPIGDQFRSLFDANNTYCTWHDDETEDAGLFVADGSTGWFRMAPTTAPETGFAWSPKATIASGCKAVQSVEVSPGVTRLLVGPATGTAPILYRDITQHTDNGNAFTGFETIGSIMLAQPGQVAEVEFLTLDSVKVGTEPVVGMMFDEITGDFDSLYRSHQDPPLLPPSDSLFNDRYYCNQSQQPSFCRHVQIKFSWAAEDAANELLSYTIFGAVYQEKR